MDEQTIWPERAFHWRVKRGLLELDVLFERFMSQGFAALSQEELLVFQRLLQRNDMLLQTWLVFEKGLETALSDEYALIHKILAVKRLRSIPVYLD